MKNRNRTEPEERSLNLERDATKTRGTFLRYSCPRKQDNREEFSARSKTSEADDRPNAERDHKLILRRDERTSHSVLDMKDIIRFPRSILEKVDRRVDHIHSAYAACPARRLSLVCRGPER